MLDGECGFGCWNVFPLFVIKFLDVEILIGEKADTRMLVGRIPREDIPIEHSSAVIDMMF